jgi:thioredoxin reductase (NADPH)
VQNLDHLTGEEALCRQIDQKDNIEVILNTTVNAILGDNVFKGITTLDAKTNNTSDLLLDGMFVAIGLIPQNEDFANVLKLNKYGYADYSEDCTCENGIFVAGDCRSKEIRQVTTAVSDGAVSALAACKYIESL